MGKDLTDKEFIDRLIESGWSQHEAEKEVEKMYTEAAIEDGMDYE